MHCSVERVPGSRSFHVVRGWKSLRGVFAHRILAGAYDAHLGDNVMCNNHQYDIGTNPLVRIVLLSAYYIYYISSNDQRIIWVFRLWDSEPSSVNSILFK